MPVPDYSVLKGTITAGSVQQPDSNKPPHYHLAVTASGRTYDVAVNIESQDQSEVLYQVRHDFQPPDPRGLLHLEVGMNPLASRPNGLALDFIREHLVQRQEMQLLQFDARHPLNPFHNDIDNLVRAAIGDPTQDGAGLLERVASGDLDPAQVVTHRLPLADAAEAYRLFDCREATKVVLSP